MGRVCPSDDRQQPRKRRPVVVLRYRRTYVRRFCRDYAYVVSNVISRLKEAKVAVAKKSQDKNFISPDAAVAGVLALLVDARESRVKEDKDAVKTEVLLSNAGLSISDIATLMGKKYDAVKMSIRRNRGK
jgi:hypothetical protein